MFMTLEHRAKQPHDEQKSGGNQPTYISLINRRERLIPPLPVS
jgi:hypothetical protein